MQDLQIVPKLLVCTIILSLRLSYVAPEPLIQLVSGQTLRQDDSDASESLTQPQSLENDQPIALPLIGDADCPPPGYFYHPPTKTCWSCEEVCNRKDDLDQSRADEYCQINCPGYIRLRTSQTSTTSTSSIFTTSSTETTISSSIQTTFITEANNIQSNFTNDNNWIIPLIVILIVCVILAAIIAFLRYKKQQWPFKKCQRKNSRIRMHAQPEEIEDLTVYKRSSGMEAINSKACTEGIAIQESNTPATYLKTAEENNPENTKRLMSEVNKNKLKRGRAEIVENLNMEYIMNDLISDEVLNPSDAETIRVEKTRKKRVETFLDIFALKPDEKFSTLIDILEKNDSDHIARILNPEPRLSVIVADMENTAEMSSEAECKSEYPVQTTASARL